MNILLGNDTSTETETERMKKVPGHVLKLPALQPPTGIRNYDNKNKKTPNLKLDLAPLLQGARDAAPNKEKSGTLRKKIHKVYRFEYSSNRKPTAEDSSESPRLK